MASQEVISNRRGLFCRFPGGCDVFFLPDGSVEGIQSSALLRDSHEVEIHGYRHSPVIIPELGYGQHRLSTRGLSTLSLRKLGRLT